MSKSRKQNKKPCPEWVKALAYSVCFWSAIGVAVYVSYA